MKKLLVLDYITKYCWYQVKKEMLSKKQSRPNGRLSGAG
jgi:hypothetical protein